MPEADALGRYLVDTPVCNGRGTAERWIKDGKYALIWMQLPCHDLMDNRVLLQLFVLAYNLANFLRTEALPRGISHWPPSTLREKLLKIGAKVVRHARNVVFQMAETIIPRPLFATIRRRIGRLRSSPPAYA